MDYGITLEETVAITRAQVGDQLVIERPTTGTAIFFPRTPACYGFTIVAPVKPGHADAMREYGYALAEALEQDPYLLAPLKLHYLRWVLFDDDTRFMYQEDGNTEFNMFLWMPPGDDRAADVLLADSTIFSTLFGADDSLRNFWRNLVS